MAIQLHPGENEPREGRDPRATRAETRDREARAPGLPKRVGLLLRDTAKAWSRDGASDKAAALSFYTLFSLSPLLVVAIGVAGLLYGQEASRDAAMRQVEGMMGAQAAQSVRTMLDHSLTKGGGLVATLVGVAGLILGASGVFGHLQQALNAFWKVAPDPGRGFLGVLRDRLLSFALVVFMGFLLLASLAASTALAALGETLASYLPLSSLALQAINFGISLAMTAALFAVLFRVLPDGRTRWRDLWVGAFMTAFLFSVGRYLIGLYLARGSVSSPYGAAGSLVILLLWIYYSSQVLFYGAEFTRIFAERFGAGVEPKWGARKVEERVEDPQGAKA